MRAVGDEPADVAHTRNRLADASRHFVIALDEAGRPVGRAYAYELPRPTRPRSGMVIYEIDVAEAARRRGAGRAMVAEPLRIARDRGVDRVRVPTDVSSAAAMRLYAPTGARRTRLDDAIWTWDVA